MASLFPLTGYTPNPTFLNDSPALSALVSLLPLVLFFFLMGVMKVKTHWCAIWSLLLAIVIAIVGAKMSISMSLLSAGQGLAFGILPICYIVVAAVWLYNISDRSGRSDDVRAIFNTVGKGDMRVQALLVSFAFCGLLEGLAGFGAPVAIVAAMLLTLGFPPLKAALLTIVGNALNVGFGAMAIPVTTAGQLGGSDANLVATYMGHITPPMLFILPFVLLLIADGIRGVRQMWLPAIVMGVTAGALHFLCTAYFNYTLTAVVSSLGAFAAVYVFLLFWTPKTPEDMRSEAEKETLGASRSILALLPYVTVIIIFAIAQLLPLKDTDIKVKIPGLYGELLTTSGDVSSSPIFNIPWLSSPGTLIVISAIIVGAIYSVTSTDRHAHSFGQTFVILRDTLWHLRYSVLTIATVMALAYVMNYSGQTVAIGTFLALSGGFFAFLAPVVGWIGTAVTGSATSANALFAPLQANAAAALHIDPALLLAANTIGGGLGKICSPQNLTIAATAIKDEGCESKILVKAAPLSAFFLVILALIVGLASMGFASGYFPHA